MMQPYLLIPNEKPMPPVLASLNSEEKKPVSLFAGKRVVIVEDEGITQMQLRRMLKHVGLIVLDSAVNGPEGVEIVLRERPDIVLMDIRMPGAFDGLEAARRILAEVNVCIIMLTAFSDEEYRKQAEAVNTCGYVIKPVTTESLIPEIEVAFRNFCYH